jgi:YD repeat-containing protein
MPSPASGNKYGSLHRALACGALSDNRKHRLLAIGWLLALLLAGSFATSAAHADSYSVPALYKWGIGGGYMGGLPPPQQATDTALETAQNLCGIWGTQATHLLVIPDLQGWRQTLLCVDQDGIEQGHAWINQTGYCPVFPTFSLIDSGDAATIDSPNCTLSADGGGCFFDDGDPAGSGYPIHTDVGFVTCRVYYFNPFKTPGPSCNRVGNPIDPFTGNKYEYEIDFSAPNNSLLTFGRHYNSHSGQAFQDVWTHTFYRKITPDFFTQHSVEMYRPEGARWTFVMSGNIGTPDADINATLQRQVDANGATAGYLFIGPNDERETYDASGNIVKLKERSGRSLSFAYSNAGTSPAIAPKPGLLISITDDFGRSLHLNYNAGSKMSKLIEPDGRYVTYQYDTGNRLSSVVYPDSTSRTYLYDEAAYTSNVSFPLALTGIVDENNVRFATFRYDRYGRAIGSEHAGGADKVSITNVDFHPIIVDGKGTSVALEAQNVLGVPKVISSSIPYPYCGSGSKAAQVDARGNFISRTDFNDHKTCYAYEPVRNLETVRVEGVLTGEACATVLGSPPNRADVRTVLTSWHPTYRLPATITEPAPEGTKTTVFTYDPGTGDLLQKAITAPANDGTGHSITRTWQWTYFSFGRVHTATDPNGKITTTSYYDNDPDIGKNGNTKKITNPLQHVTTFNSYDPNGRPLTVIDPNGLVTTLSYHPRGWLASRQVGTEPTGYAYDGVGQLTKAILPDGSFVQYTYDDAHRLTQISDGLYDKIVYTLDAMGNRIKEEVFDPNKTLTRTRQQVYDSLNRLHQSIGAL